MGGPLARNAAIDEPMVSGRTIGMSTGRTRTPSALRLSAASIPTSSDDSCPRSGEGFSRNSAGLRCADLGPERVVARASDHEHRIRPSVGQDPDGPGGKSLPLRTGSQQGFWLSHPPGRPGRQDDSSDGNGVHVASILPRSRRVLSPQNRLRFLDFAYGSPYTWPRFQAQRAPERRWRRSRTGKIGRSSALPGYSCAGRVLRWPLLQPRA